MRLKGKVAIVTGGSSGIGRAIEIEYAKEGAKVVVADIREEPIEGGKKTIDIIKEQGQEAIFIKTDVSIWEDVNNLVTKTVKKYNKLDVYVNNAAYMGAGKPLVETSEQEWDKAMNVNLKGAFFGCKRAIMQMMSQEVVNEARGRIVNVTSQHGMVAALNNMSYGVSKSGLVYLTRQVATDYAKDYIICNAVAPGRILTGRPTTEESKAYSQSRTPYPRLGKPKDVATAAVFLASDEAKFITGVNLMVDGGWMAS
jgi:NAD(P)-dependent dehydrogenase (short-subunit alcohol dehydrogenase family)